MTAQNFKERLEKDIGDIKFNRASMALLKFLQHQNLKIDFANTNLLYLHKNFIL